MRSSLAASDIRFAPARSELRPRGLIGWVCCSYGDLQLNGLALRQLAHDGYTLAFPTRTGDMGERHAIYRPLDQAARGRIEAQVIGELRRRGHVL